MSRPFTVRSIVLILVFAILSCNTDTSKSKIRHSASVRDTTTSANPKTKNFDKLPKNKIDFRKELNAIVLVDMLNWNSFEIQKYLLGQDFDLLTGGRSIDYLFQEPEFNIPDEIRDSLVFEKTVDQNVLTVKILTDDHYNYTDEQRRHVYRYKGDPRLYPDPFNARRMSPKYSDHHLRLFSKSHAAILSYIQYLESLGCSFKKDIAFDLAQDEFERSIPNYERPQIVVNSCKCPRGIESKFNGASINFSTSFNSESPEYQLNISNTVSH